MDIEEDLTQAFKKLKDDDRERNFVQTADLIVNLKGVDLDNPENRFSSDVILPNGRGKEREICVIADSKISEAKKLDVNIIAKDQLKKLEGEKGEIKSIAKENDYFLAEAPLMPTIGKIMGPVLGPRGKMPKPFSPGDDLKELLGKSEKSLTVKVGEDPVLHFPVGTEEMDPEMIQENASAVIDRIGSNLPKGPQQIGSIYVKFTMSKPVRVL